MTKQRQRDIKIFNTSRRKMFQFWIWFKRHALTAISSYFLIFSFSHEYFFLLCVLSKPLRCQSTARVCRFANYFNCRNTLVNLCVMLTATHTPHSSPGNNISLYYFYSLPVYVSVASRKYELYANTQSLILCYE